MAYVYFDSKYAPVGFLIVPDGGDPYAEGTTTLIQSDWDFPDVAKDMGWSFTASNSISAAYDYIRAHEAEEFPSLNAYLPPNELVENHNRKASMNLAETLAKTARILCEDEQPNSDSTLQALVGDPADARTSTFVQFNPNPGTMQLPNPLSPMEGDEVFFAYMIPGSRFQAHDGSEWMIQNYTGSDEVEIYNIWYPSLQGIVSVNDVRRSIHQWTNPVTQTIGHPPAGVDYGAMPVKIVDGPERVGNADENTGVGVGTNANSSW